MQHFLRILSLLLMALAACRSAIAAPPDIVFLLADDLDKLAAAGAKLEHFYVLPVCTPTRVAFLTGRYPIRSGMQLNVLRQQSKYGTPLEERTIANALHDAGYITAICGKWHVDPLPISAPSDVRESRGV